MNKYFKGYKIGTKIKIKGIKDPGVKVQDADLNGRTGRLDRKFPDIPFGDIGVHLDPTPDKRNNNLSTRANIKMNEFWVIEN